MVTGDSGGQPLPKGRYPWLPARTVPPLLIVRLLDRPMPARGGIGSVDLERAEPLTSVGPV